MTTVMETQKENAIKVFYVAVGAPVVTGRKTKDFGTELFTEASITDLGGTSRMVMDFGTQLFMETSIAEFEAAGRELGGSIRESNMVEQLQEGVEHIQEAKVLAAQKGTSVSQMLADHLKELVRGEKVYDAAKTRAIARLQTGMDLGWSPADDRQELHER